MSARGGWLQGALARLAGALSFNKSASRASDPEAGAVAAIPTPARPVDGEYNERELRDRERELRILMSTWM